MYLVYQNGRTHLTDACHLYQASLAPPEPTWPADVRLVMQHIHAHMFEESLTVEWIKRECGISDNNISGRFKYYVGQGIKAYINNHRIGLAKHLLGQNQTTILTIALEIGYSSHAAFAVSFKRHVGCTPATFRESVQKNVKRELKRDVKRGP